MGVPVREAPVWPVTTRRNQCERRRACNGGWEAHAPCRAGCASTSRVRAGAQARPALNAQAAGDQRVARPTFLDEWLKKRSSTCDLDEDKLGYLNSLSLETWNSDYFRIYPLLIIFPAATVDPEWLSLCKSKYVMVAATEDGWMNEETKVSWFKKCIELGFPPFAGGQSIINQSDGHYSNLSLELLQLQKQYCVDTLITPGHHTAVLQQADQRGGPIHLTNMILRSLLLKERMRYPGQNIPKVRAEADAPHMAQLEMLMCTILSARCRHSNYMHALCDRASPSTCYAQNVLVRAAEMAVAASYTPWTFRLPPRASAGVRTRMAS